MVSGDMKPEKNSESSPYEVALSACMASLSALIDRPLALYEPETSLDRRILGESWFTAGTEAVSPKSLDLLATLNSETGITAAKDLDGESRWVSMLPMQVDQLHSFGLFMISREEPDSRVMVELQAILMPALRSLVQARDMATLQKSMRYQIIWAECLEWLKTLTDVSNVFSDELLRRVSLIADAPCSCMVVEPALWKENNHKEDMLASPEKKMLTRNLPRTLARALCLRLNDLIQEDLTSVHTMPLSELVSVQERETFAGWHSEMEDCQTVATVPVYVRQRCVALMVLFIPAFSLDVLTQVYIEQLLSQVSSNIEKATLLSELEKSFTQVKQEKEEQNRLIETLSNTQNQLVQSEKMASIGQLAAGVAHEINNPVGYVSSNLYTLKGYIENLFSLVSSLNELVESEAGDGLSEQWRALLKTYDLEFLNDDVQDLLKESSEGLDRVKAIVQDLKDFSHVGDTQMQMARLDDLLDKTLNILNNELKYKCTIEKEFSPVEQIECVPTQISQVVMNLLVNASHAIVDRGVITIKLWQEGPQARIQVRDTGGGISPENLEKLFDPFFTTKPVGKGTGLGLSISYGIIRKHQGSIEFSSELGKGTTVDIALPVKQKAMEEADNHA